jgi:hypothetical protein
MRTREIVNKWYAMRTFTSRFLFLLRRPVKKGRHLPCSHCYYLVPWYITPTTKNKTKAENNTITTSKVTMGKAKKTRKFAVTKKMISPKDTRIQENLQKMQQKVQQKKEAEKPKHVEKAISSLFFQYNTQLGPPYHILIDTNFINFSIRKKLDIIRSMMDCLLAKCTPCVTDWYVNFTRLDIYTIYIV